MGNPIFVEERLVKPKAFISSAVFHSTHAILDSEIISDDDLVDYVFNPNDHPIRQRFLEDARQERVPNELSLDDTDDLEAMIIRQLRPRSISLLFGNTIPETFQEENGENASMETIMSRLRRQLRNSSTRLAQDVALTHRNQRSEPADARDRLEMDRLIRRVRQERRTDNMLFHSAFYRWNMARDVNTNGNDLLNDENMARNRVRRSIYLSYLLCSSPPELRLEMADISGNVCSIVFSHPNGGSYQIMLNLARFCRNLVTKPFQKPNDAIWDDYESFSASELAQATLNAERTPFEVVWDEGDIDETLVGEFEILSSVKTPPPKRKERLESLTKQEWNELIESKDYEQLRHRIVNGGLDVSLRKLAWPCLLNVYPLGSSQAEREAIKEENRLLYNQYNSEWQVQVECSPPCDFINENLIRIQKDVVRTDRALSYYPRDEDLEQNPENHIASNPKLTQLMNILMTFTSSFPMGEPLFVQGMADLASTLLVTIEDESEAFWCLVALMEKYSSNFYEDGSGMNRQLGLLRKVIQELDLPLYTKLEKLDSLNLFGCFRWLLVLFRREFEFSQAQLLWDVILCSRDKEIPTLICYAILETKRNVIVNKIEEGDELLRFLGSLAQNLDIEQVYVDLN